MKGPFEVNRNGLNKGKVHVTGSRKNVSEEEKQQTGCFFNLSLLKYLSKWKNKGATGGILFAQKDPHPPT